MMSPMVAEVVDLERPLYGVGQAAELLGLRRDRVSAWLDGYERKGTQYPPVIRQESTGSDIVTWGEFLELSYLREYRKADVSLQSIRPVIAKLRDQYSMPYPLATVRPFVMDRELIEQLQDEHDVDRRLHVVIRTGQGLLDLAPGASRYFRRVNFSDIDHGGVARTIAPAGPESPVLIDPDLAFGQPAVDGIATERLFELYEAGEPTEHLARVYELPLDRVRAAISYEDQLRSVAA